ncbi:hypothetical protein EW026_g5829 [Hermanssonia centrifuga]|uniref:mRNA 3'-end-processing protein RNA14 n=1 Tax=Hermanssonia centrifuga TaxID=98765 RepID=A0A4S4KD44_9APHY|nr:hypothetical protein EW026_g5829 [Hermanssonia centrifuga]
MTSGPNTRETVRKVYEFALNHIGQDKEATEIWTDYIQFLKAGESATTWDYGHKMDSVRKAYQRAVQIPMDDVKRIWEEYQEFENNLNKITAKKFISDLSVAHMQARTVLNQLQEHLTVLFPPLPPPKVKGPSIYIPRATTLSAGEKALVGRWRIYFKWEERNLLELEEKDRATLRTRVQGVYSKAVVRMRFFSEIWYMAYVWNINHSNDQSLLEAKRKDKKNEALSLLERGIEANPASFLLNFAYAEAQEASKKFGDVHTSFTKFLEVLRKELDELASRVNFSPPSSQESAVAVDRTDARVGWPDAGSASQVSSFNSQTSEGQPPKNKELVERRTEYGLAWIVYMRFARRAENLKSARAIFGKSRRDRWTPWQVYEAAALMEYHCTKATDVAMRIFEKGLENFSNEAEFALKYLGFLISINDDSNARALFERAVNSFSPERARPIWERWARYEYQFGNLEAAHILEKRMSYAYPNG